MPKLNSLRFHLFLQHYLTVHSTKISKMLNYSLFYYHTALYYYSLAHVILFYLFFFIVIIHSRSPAPVPIIDWAQSRKEGRKQARVLRCLYKREIWFFIFSQYIILYKYMYICMYIHAIYLCDICFPWRPSC